MAILILGANGFIGSAVLASLSRAGYDIIGLGRDIAHARNRFPSVKWVRADLSKLTRPNEWMPLLIGIETVINCAGALQDGLRDDIAATQRDSMLALYQAARHGEVRLVVQISARTEGGENLAFLATKAAADTALKQSGLPYVILRPALVLGRNAYGGSALLRALAALPLINPLIYADRPVQTVSVDDLAEAVRMAVDGEIPPGTDADLSGETLDLGQLVQLHRAWLGLPPARIVPVPTFVGGLISWFADLAGRLGWRSPLRSTAMQVMAGGVTTGDKGLGLPLRTARETLAMHPAGVQDLWFARLYLLKPVLIVALALFWLASGAVPFFNPGRAAIHFLPYMSPAVATGLTILTSVLDMALGLGVLYRPCARRALIGQIALACAYLGGGTLMEAALWLDPLGPYVKVLPAIALSLAALAILDER
jgi:uncharacterized protein YbjT (DUF2867 family)